MTASSSARKWSQRNTLSLGYREVLDLVPLTANADTCAIDDPERFQYLVNTGSLMVLGLHEGRAVPTPGDPGSSPLDHVAISVSGVDIASLHGWLEADGRAPGPIVAWRYGCWVEICDPDGIPLRLFVRSAV